MTLPGFENIDGVSKKAVESIPQRRFVLKIGLYPIDSKMANLALMKISAWHKRQGDDTELFNPLWPYDKVYVSQVFNYTNIPNAIHCQRECGGTGHDIKKCLPDEMENCDPDYSIYPNCDYSIQLFSRGCPRKCSFCVVPEKEGDIRPVKPMKLNPNGKRIEILDNNFFANPEWKNAIGFLKLYNQPVNFHGVDARLLTDKMMIELNRLRHFKQIHMSWDSPNYKVDWLKIIKIISPYKIMCYVLIGYNSTKEEDLYRVEKLRSFKIDPFVMPYNKNDTYQKRFARWVNHKAIFKSVKWENYRRGTYSNG